MNEWCVTYLPVFVMIISVPNSWNFSHKSFVSKWHWIGFNSSQLHEPKSVGRVCCRWRRKCRTHAASKKAAIGEWKSEEKEKELIHEYERNIIYYWMILWREKSNFVGLGIDFGILIVIKTTWLNDHTKNNNRYSRRWLNNKFSSTNYTIQRDKRIRSNFSLVKAKSQCSNQMKFDTP